MNLNEYQRVHGHSDLTSSNFFPLKSLGQLKPNFMWILHGMGEWKFVQTFQVTWPRQPPCPYMVKTLKIFSQTKRLMTLKVDMQHRVLEYYQVLLYPQHSGEQYMTNSPLVWLGFQNLQPWKIIILVKIKGVVLFTVSHLHVLITSQMKTVFNHQKEQLSLKCTINDALIGSR